VPAVPLALMFAASYVPGYEGWLLAGGVLGWAVLASFAPCPRSTAGPGTCSGTAVRRKPHLAAVAIVGPLVVLYAAHEWVLDVAPGATWSGLGLIGGLLLSYTAFGLLLERASLARSKGIGRSALAAAVVAIWPLLTAP
jgi:hypothetical protein